MPVLRKETVAVTYAKFAAAAALFCLPLQAHAQSLDLTPDSSRILSDPNYLPLAGQIDGSTAYTHGWMNGTGVNSAGDAISSFHINTNIIGQSLGYGITDDLSVNGSVQYVPRDYREVNNANGQSASLDSSGFSDPTFGLTWRALDQRAWPVNLDLFGSYTPDWIGAETASAVQDGTVARGGQSGAVGAAVGYETRSFSIRGAFTEDFFGTSNRINLANGNLLDAAGYNNSEISLNTQTRFTDLFSVNAGVQHTFAANENAVDVTNGVAHTSESGDLTALHLALNYQFVPNAFVVSATYDYEAYGNGRTLFADSALDTGTRNRNANIIGVKLQYATP
ncbi:MAG TPA: hypothetical protein VGI20_07785 [Rhizomicrobium sp.]|jgi:hypothetical protein